VENILDQDGRVSLEWGGVEFVCVCVCVWGGDPDCNTRKSDWLCEGGKSVCSEIRCVTMKCYPQHVTDVSSDSSVNIVTG